jgi:hypothetical protein
MILRHGVAETHVQRTGSARQLVGRTLTLAAFALRGDSCLYGPKGGTLNDASLVFARRRQFK